MVGFEKSSGITLEAKQLRQCSRPGRSSHARGENDHIDSLWFYPVGRYHDFFPVLPDGECGKVGMKKYGPLLHLFHIELMCLWTGKNQSVVDINNSAVGNLLSDQFSCLGGIDAADPRAKSQAVLP